MIKLSTKFAAAGLALMLGTASASASVAVTIEQDGFGSGPIKVISEDGQKWTKIVDGDLTLPVKIYLGISSGGSKAITSSSRRVGGMAGTSPGVRRRAARRNMSAHDEGRLARDR